MRNKGTVDTTDTKEKFRAPTPPDNSTRHVTVIYTRLTCCSRISLNIKDWENNHNKRGKKDV